MYEPSCSGTLLSQYWVLTSGSCLTECDVPQLYIAVASQGRNPKNSSAKYCYLYPDHTRTVDLALMEASFFFEQLANVLHRHVLAGNPYNVEQHDLLR